MSQDSTQRSTAYTITGFGGYLVAWNEEEARSAVRQQLIEKTTFKVFPFRTCFADTRTGGALYEVTSATSVRIQEEVGSCTGFLAHLLPELTLVTAHKEQPQRRTKATSKVLPFPNETQRLLRQRGTRTVPPPRDEQEEELRCRLLRAFPTLGDYALILIFIDGLNSGIEDLQRAQRPLTAANLTQCTTYSEHLTSTYLTLLEETGGYHS